MVFASSDTKIEDSNEKVDKKDTDENGKSDPSDATDNKNGDNSENKDAGNANPSGTSNNQTKEQSGVNNNQSNYKVTVDSSVDTAAEEKKLVEQHKKARQMTALQHKIVVQKIRVVVQRLQELTKA